MKIAYCLKSLYNSGGMERIISLKANALAQLGHEIIIITTDQNERSPFYTLDKSIRCRDLDINYDEIENDGIIRKFLLRRRRINLHKERLQKAIDIYNIDILISTFGNEIFFLHKLSGVKVRIGEIHFCGNYRFKLKQSLLRKAINLLITRQYKSFAKKLDAFVCLTEEDKKNWRGLSNLFVIPNFIVEKATSISSQNTKRAIMLGRLTYQKGYEYAIRVWKIVNETYPEWILDIYGSGELKNTIETLIHSYKLDDVIKIHNPIPNTTEVLQNSSIYLMTSRYEGFPMVLIEAMGSGLPIISFDCECGPKDLIGKTGVGVLVNLYDEKAFAQEIITLIENENLRKNMGILAYKEVEKYTLRNIIPKWEALFEICLNKR